MSMFQIYEQTVGEKEVTVSILNLTHIHISKLECLYTDLAQLKGGLNKSSNNIDQCQVLQSAQADMG